MLFLQLNYFEMIANTLYNFYFCQQDVCEENGNVGTETPDTTYAQMRSKAKRMDVISRVTFPVIFFLFSLGYWAWYLRKAFGSKENEI